MEERRRRLQIVRQNAAVDGGDLLAEAVGTAVRGQFPAGEVDLLFQVLGFFYPRWRESVVPKEAMRHAQRRIFVRILFQIQRPALSGQVVESSFGHCFPDLSFGYVLPVVHGNCYL